MTVKQLYLNKEAIAAASTDSSMHADFRSGTKQVTRKNAPHVEQMLMYGLLCNEANSVCEKREVCD